MVSPHRDKLEENLGCNGESGVALDELCQLVLLFACHELYRVMVTRKGAKNIDESVRWDDGIAAFAGVCARVVFKYGVELLLQIGDGLSIASVGFLRGQSMVRRGHVARREGLTTAMLDHQLCALGEKCCEPVAGQREPNTSLHCLRNQTARLTTCDRAPTARVSPILRAGLPSPVRLQVRRHHAPAQSLSSLETSPLLQCFRFSSAYPLLTGYTFATLMRRCLCRHLEMCTPEHASQSMQTP